jgi:hypothetical protein
MGNEPAFSDPAWWPKPKPEPPKKGPIAAVVFGTLAPLLVIAVAAVVVLGHKNHKAAEGRSIAAFQACMHDQGADSPAERANFRFLQQDADACRNHLPQGMGVPNFQPPSDSDDSAREAFSACMQAALKNLPHGRSAFGSSSIRDAFRKAEETCRALVGGGRGRFGGGQGGGGQQPQQTTTSPIT